MRPHERSRGKQRTEREKRRDARRKRQLREGALTRPTPGTAPVLALWAKKIPTDKGWDSLCWWRRGPSHRLSVSAELAYTLPVPHALPPSMGVTPKGAFFRTSGRLISSETFAAGPLARWRACEVCKFADLSVGRCAGMFASFAATIARRERDILCRNHLWRFCHCWRANRSIVVDAHAAPIGCK